MRLMLVAVLPAVCAANALADVTLVRDGKPVGRIVALSSEEACLHAAGELQKYLRAIGGAELPITKSAEGARPGMTAVFVGTAADAESVLDDAGRQALAKLRPGGFMIQVRSSGRAAPCVCIVGKDDAGMSFGVYEFLESLGCRWYMPGDIGEEIPKAANLALADKLDVQNPDFILRNFWWGYGGRPTWQKRAYAMWRQRNKMGGVQAGMGHNLQRIISPKEFGTKNPEYFPLRGKTRYVPASAGEHGWQPCTTNPKVIEIAANKAIAYFDANPDAFSFSLSPVDGYGWCECERCTAQDPPEFRDSKSRGKGRRMSIFANAVAERLAQKHPRKYVCWYAYAGAVEAPADVGVHPNVVISLAHYGWCGCNIHALNDPKCPNNPKFLKILDDWASKDCKLFIREYWTTLVGTSDMPARVCAAYSLANDIPFLKSKGVIGFSSESVPDYGACALNFWLAARKMWRADADTGRLLNDYYTGMYGPAAALMRGYFEGILKACRGRGCRGSFFTLDELGQMRGKLEQAAMLCATDKQRQRVGLTRESLDFVLQMRGYVKTPSSDERKALVETVTSIVGRQSLAVDSRSFLSRLGRGRKADPTAGRSLCGAKLRPLTTQPMPADAAKAAFTVRGKHTFVVLAKAGERVRGRVEVRRLGRYLSGAAFVLLSPGGKALAEGAAAVGEAGAFDVVAVQGGVHVLVLNTGRNAARVYVENQYFCLAGRSLHLLGGQPDACICLEPSAQQGTVSLSSPAGGSADAPGETAAMVVFDPDGKEVARGDTTSGRGFEAALEPARGQLGKPWRVRIGKAPRGVLEDLTLVLGQGTAGFVATHPTRMLTPEQ